MRQPFFGFLLWLLLLPQASAFAQAGGEATPDGSSEGEARALFAAGREAFDAGKYAAALSRWQEAFKLSKRPELLYNLGLAYDRLRRDDEAVLAFEAFIVALPDDPNVPEVRSRIQAIRDARAAATKLNARAPTPAQTAAAAQASDKQAAVKPVAGTREEDETPWYGRWYTWAGAGGIVAGAVVIALLASSPAAEVKRAQPNSGVTIQALGGRL